MLQLSPSNESLYFILFFSYTGSNSYSSFPAAIMAAPLIWINAFPGTGKLTIAKAIKALDESVIVIDNHQLIDPVASAIPRDDLSYQAERKREREGAFQKYVYDRATASQTVVFTGKEQRTARKSIFCFTHRSTDRRADFQSDNELGRSVAKEYLMAAKKARRPFMPVYLGCDVKVNIERAMSRDRMSGTTTKLTDAALLRDMRSRYKLFEFDDQDGSTWIDTTNKEPEGVAKMILGRSRVVSEGK